MRCRHQDMGRALANILRRPLAVAWQMRNGLLITPRATSGAALALQHARPAFLAIATGQKCHLSNGSTTIRARICKVSNNTSRRAAAILLLLILADRGDL